MPKLLMLKGLPASGKSTYAKELAAKGNYVRVNKDDLRAMLHAGKFGKANEQQVLRIRDAIIADALASKQNVVVDDTNFAPEHETRFKQLAKNYGAEFHSKFFEIDPAIAIERDLNRPVSVGAGVIMRMYNQYLAPKQAIYIPPTGKPPAIIVDVDGTLAHGIHGNGREGHRKPFEWGKVGDDTLDEAVKEIVNNYADRGYEIIVVTGRDGVAYEATSDWLTKHGIKFNHLFARAVGDNRNDAIFKKEIFDNHIKDNFNIKLVLDDRDRVVKMWRNLGLKVLQVAEGDF